MPFDGRTYKYEEHPRGHIWKVDDDGDLDIFAFACGPYCNGPRCVTCGYGFCQHCTNEEAEVDCRR
jgi:hypothetical protein